MSDAGKWLFFLVYTSVVMAVLFLGAFETAEWFASDGIVRVRHLLADKDPVFGKMVVIEVDDYTFKSFNSRPPLPRSVYTALLEKLGKLEPKVIAFDLVFTGYSADQTQDYLLAAQMTDMPNVIMSAYYAMSGELIHPLPLFIKGSNFGIINKPLSKDGAIRYARTAYVEKTGDDMVVRPTFETLIFLNMHEGAEVELKESGLYTAARQQLKTTDYTYPINYRAVFNEFTRVSLYDFLKNDIAKHLIQDKVVFITSTSLAEHDVHMTSLGLQPGIVVIANALATIMKGMPYNRIPFGMYMVLLYIIGALVFFMTDRMRSLMSGLVFVCACLPAVMAAAVAASFYNTDINPFRIICVCAGAYFYTVIWRNYRVRREMDAMREAALKDELTGLYIPRYMDLALGRELDLFKRYKRDLCFCFIGIDDFQQMLETLTMDQQSRIIREVSKRLAKAAAEGDICGYFGNGVFGIIMTGIEGDKTYSSLNHYKSAVSGLYELPDTKYTICVSCAGAMALQGRHTTIGALHSDAEQALLHAREIGRGALYVSESALANFKKKQKGQNRAYPQIEELFY